MGIQWFVFTGILIVNAMAAFAIAVMSRLVASVKLTFAFMLAKMAFGISDGV